MLTETSSPVSAHQAAAPAVAPLLKLRGLEAWYGESHVLHGIDLDVAPGEVVTLLGRNGAGKTTTLKSIMGVMGKRRGSVTFDGHETIRMPSRAIARLGIGYVPEERGIYSSLNVEENLMLPPQVRPGGLSLDQIFTLFPNIKERLKSQGTKLSGGEQQMLAIGAHPAHRRQSAAARRADGGAGPGDHRADRPHHRAAEAGGLHHRPGRAEFPLRRDGGRPALCRRAGQGDRHDPQQPNSTPTSTSCTAISGSSVRDLQPEHQVENRHHLTGEKP